MKEIDDTIDHACAHYFNNDGNAYFEECHVKGFMQEYAEQFKPNWIPVSERLPDLSGNYIVCKYNGLVTEMYYEAYPKLFSWRGSYQTSQITHWMTLPEKPNL